MGNRVFHVTPTIGEDTENIKFVEQKSRQLHLDPGPDGALIQGGVFVLPRALSPAPFGQFRWSEADKSLHTTKGSF